MCPSQIRDRRDRDDAARRTVTFRGGPQRELTPGGVAEQNVRRAQQLQRGIHIPHRLGPAAASAHAPVLDQFHGDAALRERRGEGRQMCAVVRLAPEPSVQHRYASSRRPVPVEVDDLGGVFAVCDGTFGRHGLQPQQ